MAEFVPTDCPLVFGIALGEATTTIDPGAAFARPGFAANRAGGKENVGVGFEGTLLAEALCTREESDESSLFCISSFLSSDGSSG